MYCTEVPSEFSVSDTTDEGGQANVEEPFFQNVETRENACFKSGNTP